MCVHFLLPIWSCFPFSPFCFGFAVWFKTKDAKIKAITLPSAFSAMLGITEAAIFGINLRFVKPFIAALVGGAAGGVDARLHDRGGPDGDPGDGYCAGQLAAELHYRNGDRLRRGLRALSDAEIQNGR